MNVRITETAQYTAKALPGQYRVITDENPCIRVHFVTSERIRKLKQGAKDRDLVFELSDTKVKEFIHQDCYYCGQPNADGIDRLDSSVGYTEENCVPCCGVCNIMKNRFTTDTFFNHIELIYKKHFSNVIKNN